MSLSLFFLWGVSLGVICSCLFAGRCTPNKGVGRVEARKDTDNDNFCVVGPFFEGASKQNTENNVCVRWFVVLLGSFLSGGGSCNRAPVHYPRVGFLPAKARGTFYK